VQKQIFICILPRRSIWNRVKDTNLSVSEYCSGLQRTRKRSEHDASDLRQTHGSLYPELRDTPPDQRIPRNTDKNRTLRSIPPPTECCWSLKSGMKLCKVRCPAYKKRRSGKPERRRMWRWRESNPRPNKEPESFLHAYPPFRPSIRVWQAAT